MSTEKIQRLIARACFGREGEALPEEGIDPDDLAALDPKRLRLYRGLVRHNVVSVIETLLPATKKRLEAFVPGEMRAAIDDFLALMGPKTPHLRDVVGEFVAFATRARWPLDDRLPPWMSDHARLELAEFTFGAAPRAPVPPPLVDVDATRPLFFREPASILHLGWAVNGLAEDAEPEPREVAILIYRDAAHVVRFLELTPLAAAILDLLLRGETLGEAMTSACAALRVPLDEQVLNGAARLLADLGERGVLLGATENPRDR